MFRQMGLVFILAFVLALSVNAQEGVKYKKGDLNIKCKCLIGKEKLAEWHHTINIPNDSFSVNFTKVCKASRDNYSGIEEACSQASEFLGEEFAFDPL